jgi:glutamine amidotransferase
VATDPDGLDGASRIILPGVGAMAPAMRRLRESGLAARIDRMVREEATPFLGICLGMQMMCKSGFEGERTECLGWIDADVRALPAAPPTWLVPNMGWCELRGRVEAPVFDGVRDRASFYFCHSYAAGAPDAPTIARVGFGPNDNAVTAALWRGSAVGVQFHPERSGNNGLRLIENFLAWDGSGRTW